MPTIGSFRQDDLFGQEGILETPTLKARIKFVPLRDHSGKQPDYRILLGKREVGAAWITTLTAPPRQARTALSSTVGLAMFPVSQNCGRRHARRGCA